MPSIKEIETMRSRVDLRIDDLRNLKGKTKSLKTLAVLDGAITDFKKALDLLDSVAANGRL